MSRIIDALYNFGSDYRYHISVPLAALGTTAIWAQVHFLYKYANVSKSIQGNIGMDESHFLKRKWSIPLIGQTTILSAAYTLCRYTGYLLPVATLIGEILSATDKVTKTDSKEFEWNKYTVAAEFITETCKCINFSRFGTLSIGLFAGWCNSEIGMRDSILRFVSTFLTSYGLTKGLSLSFISNIGPEFKAFKYDDGYKVSEAKAGELLVKIASVFVVAELCNQAISR